MWTGVVFGGGFDSLNGSDESFSTRPTVDDEYDEGDGPASSSDTG